MTITVTVVSTQVPLQVNCATGEVTAIHLITIRKMGQLKSPLLSVIFFV